MSCAHDVAHGRGVSVSAVQRGYGQGRIYQAKAAKDAGLIDSVSTFDATLARLTGRARAGMLRGEDDAPVLHTAEATPVTPDAMPGPADDDTAARRVRLL